MYYLHYQLKNQLKNQFKFRVGVEIVFDLKNESLKAYVLYFDILFFYD